MKGVKRVVLAGGGHSNCILLKLFKKHIPPDFPVELVLISESDTAFYSGMLPATVANLYPTEDIAQIKLAPLAAWANAKFVKKRIQ